MASRRKQGPVAFRHRLHAALALVALIVVYTLRCHQHNDSSKSELKLRTTMLCQTRQFLQRTATKSSIAS